VPGLKENERTIGRGVADPDVAKRSAVAAAFTGTNFPRRTVEGRAEETRSEAPRTGTSITEEGVAVPEASLNPGNDADERLLGKPAPGVVEPAGTTLAGT